MPEKGRKSEKDPEKVRQSAYCDPNTSAMMDATIVSERGNTGAMAAQLGSRIERHPASVHFGKCVASNLKAQLLFSSRCAVCLSARIQREVGL
jgi:hypothetical protein